MDETIKKDTFIRTGSMEEVRWHKVLVVSIGIGIFMILSGITGYFIGINSSKVSSDLLNTKIPNKISTTISSITNTPVTTQTISVTSTPTLAPADSKTPTAGTCGIVNTDIVEVNLNSDMPSPRCSKVTSNQKLKLTNNTKQTLTIQFASYKFSIAPNQSHTITDTFGTYLEVGVHKITTSLYSGSNPEIWLY